MDKKFMDNVKISYHRDPVLELVTHRAVGRAPEPLRRIGLWIINGSVEWPSQRNGYELVKKRRFGFYSLSQMVGGAGFFSPEGDDSRRVRLKAGDVIVVCPGDIHRYGGTPDSVYLEDSLRFSGALADRLRDVGLLKTGVYHWGAMRTLREIIEIQRDPSIGAQLRATVELQRFIVDLYLKSRSDDNRSYIDALIERIRRDPERWWTVDELAELCSVSRSKLRRDFLAQTGLLPKAYVESLKMRAASELLNTGESVSAVAHRMGYRDPYHFSRRFKHCFGAPPETFKPAISGGGTTPSP